MTKPLPRVLLAAPLLLAACLPAVPPTAEALPDAVTQHVVVISIDGLRPDAIERFGAETLQRLSREGSATLQARTILPAKTLPSHTSMLTGVEPSVHGVRWNTDRTGRAAVRRGDDGDPYDDGEPPDSLAVPTVFEVAHDAGLHTAAFFSKAKFRHLQAPGTLDYTQAPSRSWAPWGAQRTSEDAAWYIRHARPNLVFVHIGEPDYAGHTLGWMGRAYAANVRMADRAVARVVAAADDAYGPDGYTLLVTADHGGQGHGHGNRGADSLDVTIPWIAHGRGVRAGTTIAAPVRTTDTAATVLWLLGVPTPAFWTGRPVTAAFDAGAR